MTPDDVLQWCLEEVEGGRLTVAECAAQFPEVPDLAQQLRLARTLAQWRKPELPPQVDRVWQARLRRTVRGRQAVVAASGWRWPVLRWALVLAVAAVPLVGGAGLVSASAESVPGDALYGVKRATELARLALTPAEQQADLHVTLAATRAAELSTVVARGASAGEVVDSLSTAMLNEVEVALAQSQTTAQDRRTALLQRLLAGIASQQAALTAAQAQAEGAAQASLLDWLAASQDQAVRTQQVLNEVQAGALVTATAGANGLGVTASPEVATSTPATPTATLTPTTKAAPATNTAGVPTELPTLVVITVAPRNTATPTATASRTGAPTRTPSTTPTETSPVTPTSTATLTEAPSATPDPTDTPTATLTPTATPTVTDTASPEPSATLTPTVTGTPSPEPSATLTPTLTAEASATETAPPTAEAPGLIP